MKLTFRQLENICRDANQKLRGTPWGLSLERVKEAVFVRVIPRKPGAVSGMSFVGSIREAEAFICGVSTGAGFRMVPDPDEQEGSE